MIFTCTCTFDSEILPALPMSDAASLLRNISTENRLTNTLPSPCHDISLPLLRSPQCIPAAAGVSPRYSGMRGWETSGIRGIYWTVVPEWHEPRPPHAAVGDRYCRLTRRAFRVYAVGIVSLNIYTITLSNLHLNILANPV